MLFGSARPASEFFREFGDGFSDLCPRRDGFAIHQRLLHGVVIAGDDLIHLVVQRRSDLVKVVRALHACRGSADFLHGGQEQSNEDADDGNDDQ